MSSRHDPAGMPRPIDALLAGYAGGTLEPYLHALIESHLILSDENRAAVRALEAKVGEELDSAAPAPLGPAARDHVLAAIYAGGWYGRPRPPKINPELPEPLDRLTGGPLAKLRWRFSAPGLREHRLHRGEGVTASLFRARPRQPMPAHTHEALEATLVLIGSLHDDGHAFRRGDISVADASVDHRPTAGEEGCLCYVVTHGSIRLTGPIGRLLARLAGA